MRIFVALLFMPMAAFAADWVLIGATQKLEVEVDRQSVRPGKGVWFKIVNTPPKSENCAGTGKKVGELKLYIEANCKEHTIRTKQAIAYSEDNSVLDRCGYNDASAAFSEYAPESMGEDFFNAICDPRGRMENEVAVFIRANKPGNKPLFAECKNSSECKGNLLCKVAAGSASMLCLAPD